MLCIRNTRNERYLNKTLLAVDDLLFTILCKNYIMSVNIKKQFGVWMDSHNAIIIGKEHIDSGNFIVLGRVETDGDESNSNERTANNAKRASLQKLFKDTAAFMQNVDEVHVTGTGTVQEQFIHFLGETPQYKNTVANESTSNKMSDDKLIEYITGKFNAELVN